MGCGGSVTKAGEYAEGGQLTAEGLSGEPYNQAHLFEGASKEETKAIVAQLNEINTQMPLGGLASYLRRARNLLSDAKNDVNPLSGFVPHVPVGERLVGDKGVGTEYYAEIERLGMSQLSKCAFCLVAGGLGERLGFPGIKIGITAELTTGATFFEKYARYILAFQAHARQATGDINLLLPLAIMTSGDTHVPTVQFLAQNKNFGLSSEQIVLMEQAKVPALMDPEARLGKKDGLVETKPHGHGDVHSLLHKHGLPKKWQAEGRKWLVIFQDTNPLAFRPMCAFIGVSAANDFVMNSVCVPRIPTENIGSICKLEGSDGSHKTINVEYNMLEALLRETPLGGDRPDETGFSPYPGNINILIFGIPTLAQRLEETGGLMPEFVNPKWTGPDRSAFKSSTRLECMMQDFPLLCGPQDKVGFVLMDRYMCFTCVKNNLKDAPHRKPHDCALTCEADLYASNIKLLRHCGAVVEIEEPETTTFLGISVKMGPRLVLQPSFSMCLEKLKARVFGKIKISRKSSLIVEGDIFIHDLDLDGALDVSGSGEIKGQVVKNAGQPLENIPEDEFSSQPPSLQIRGYRCSTGEVEVLAL